MRISDWSSDVCSSDLLKTFGRQSTNPLTGDLRTGGTVLDILALKERTLDNIAQILTQHVFSRFQAMREVYGQARSEERRVGNECVSTCRSRWSRYNYKTSN